ncbi:MAG: peptidylprolyl isomerase [Bacteriovoracaceae bacterium]
MKIFLCFAVPLWLYSQSGNDTDVRILQDKRSAQTSEVIALLQSENPRKRELGLLALANIQDTASFDVAASLLNDREPRVRTMAAFSLGMIGKTKGAGALFRRLSVERDEQCIAALFNAIGMVGTADDLKKVINQTEHYPSEWNPFIGQCLYRFANRKIKEVSATKYAIKLLDDPASIINACYALMRINDSIILKQNGERIHRLMNNASPLIRMWGSTMLGVLDDEISVKRLITTAKKDKDWRVRVNAIRALKTKQKAKTDLITMISDVQEHVALAAVASVEEITSSDTSNADSTRYISLLHSLKVLPSVKDELRRLLAKRFGNRALPIIGDWRSTTVYSSAQRIRAYGDTRSEDAIPTIKEAIKQSTSSLVSIAGLEAYHTIAQNSSDDVKKDFLKSAAILLTKNDAGVSYAAAIAFQDTSISREIRSIFRSALITAYNGMKSPADLEPMVELLHVFSALGDSSALPSVEQGLAEQDKVIRSAAEKAFAFITGEAAPVNTVPDSENDTPFYKLTDLPLLDRYSGADVTTSKGKIKIVFDKEAAPFTVLNFILLTQKKFYDGLPFHRVVGNFVIQGGDPLGNGSGGPEYSIRTEAHPTAVYRTGAVGMASAGKDTEGSQWFITHSPTPHLDFRYTIFGYTRDNKVVDRIMVGDRIDSVTLF